MSSAWLLSYDGRVQNDGFDGVAKLDVHLREADTKILQQKRISVCFKSLKWLRS